MKSFAIILKSLALSLLLATSAYAADKVNINTADAATIDAVLVNVVRPRHRPSSTTARPMACSRAPKNWPWSRASA